MDFRRLFEILPFQQEKYPQKIAFAHRTGSSWETFSTSNCLQQIEEISTGLLNIGINRGDKVAIIATEGTAYWNLLDLAIQQIGGIVVPIYAITPKEELLFILEDSETKCCFVAHKAVYSTLEKWIKDSKYLKKVFALEPFSDAVYWKTILSTPTAEHKEKFSLFKAAVHEDDVATIIYTSGVTGAPKGVMLSHKNIVSNIKSIIQLVPVNCDKRTLSFLPLSYIFERMVVYTYMAVGASVYYCKPDESLTKAMQEIRPHYLTSTPRNLEGLYIELLDFIKIKIAPIRFFHNWAIRLGKRYKQTSRFAFLYFLKLQIADLLVYSWWRRRFGGKIDGIVVGAGSLNPDLARLFSAAGIDIREGYGLTEAAPVITLNRFEPGGFQFGTAGMPIPDVEVKIDAPEGETQGEIIVRGPNVMIGYYNHPDLTAQAFKEDRWFKTGDLGEWVNKRFLRIVGRKKTAPQIKGEKLVTLSNIEEKLRRSAYVDQCMAVGLNRPFVVIVILPDFRSLHRWCISKGVHWESPEKILKKKEVIELFKNIISDINKQLRSFEHITDFKLVPGEWSVANGMFTATQTLRRSVIYDKYREEIESMYKNRI